MLKHTLTFAGLGFGTVAALAVSILFLFRPCEAHMLLNHWRPASLPSYCETGGGAAEILRTRAEVAEERERSANSELSSLQQKLAQAAESLSEANKQLERRQHSPVGGPTVSFQALKDRVRRLVSEMAKITAERDRWKQSALEGQRSSMGKPK